VTRAEAEPVEPDFERAGDYIAQAKRFLADAERHSTHLESAVVLYWSVCISAMDALPRERHDVSYAAITPGAGDVAALQADARDILAVAEDFVRRSAGGSRSG
jgi:hypothetical protein